MPERDAATTDPAATPDDFGVRVTTIAALAEPVRRALYQFVAAQSEPVTRDGAAAGLGVPRHVAKFHLDRLVEDGLLEFDFRRPPERRGPGAGRPAKVYRRSGHEVAVSLPERHYELAGRLLAEAITRSEHGGEPVASEIRKAAMAAGRSLGDQVLERNGRDDSQTELQNVVMDELEGQGYEPRLDSGTITLINCPFHSLAAEYTELVCGMNLDIMDGLLDQIKGAGLEAVLDPVEGQCCVKLRAREPSVDRRTTS